MAQNEEPEPWRGPADQADEYGKIGKGSGLRGGRRERGGVLKTLSIRQPWADAIIYCGKDIENRTWNTKFRGTFLVHAAKTVDPEAPEWVWSMVREFSPDVPLLGGIIGSVELVDVVDKSDSKWFMGPKGFVLKNPKPLPFQPIKGKLNFFEVGISCQFETRP